VHSLHCRRCCAGPPTQQLQQFFDLQALLTAWGGATLMLHYQVLAETPLAEERQVSDTGVLNGSLSSRVRTQTLLSRAPETPIHLLHIVVEIMKLPQHELQVRAHTCLQHSLTLHEYVRTLHLDTPTGTRAVDTRCVTTTHALPGVSAAV
jgi:hypothetical protein